MMIKIAKLILITQAVVCVMIPIFLFNVPLESARIAHAARGLATQLANGEAGNAIVAAQANEIAAYLRAWRNILPIGIVVLPVLGALVSSAGWLALNQREKTQKLVEPAL